MTPYRFDPELKELAAQLEGPLIDWSDAEAIAASRSDRALADMFGDSEPRDDVGTTDVLVTRPGVDKVPLRIYEPKESAPKGGLLYIHGGGFMTGSVEMMDSACQSICGDVGLVVASVEYRLAPENPFPAGLEDCYGALCWFADNAKKLRIAKDRIAVAGASAGGGLAAATALLARDRGGPALCLQVLQIPELDDRLDTPSMVAFTDTPVWNRPSAQWSWRHYLGDSHGADVSAYAAPARCEDLSELPPAFVTTMEFDPLRDEGIIYALRLLQAGVSVELHQLPGTFHGSSVLPTAAMSQLENRLLLGALRRAFPS